MADADLNIMKKMVNSVLNSSFQRFCDLIYQEYGTPIVVLDSTQKLISAAPNNHKIGDVYWDATIQYKKVPDSLLIQTFNNQYIQQVLTATRNGEIAVVETGAVNLPHYVSAIIIQDRVVGYISLIKAKKDLPAETMIRTAILARDAVTIMFQKEQAQAVVSVPDLLIDFTDRIFHSRFDGQQAVQKYAEICGLEFAPSYAMLAISLLSNESFQEGYFSSLMRDLYPTHLVSTEDSVCHFLLYGLENAFHLKAVVQELSEHIMMEYTIGVSELFVDVSEIRRYQEQAAVAMEYARENPAGSKRVFFEKNRKEILMYLIRSRPSTAKKGLSYFQTLEEYDSANNTELLVTMRTFLRSFADHKKTAATLNIHRNTLTYRLKKIEDLCYINLADTDLLKNLLFSDLCI